MNEARDGHPNTDIHAYWNGVAGEKWVRLQARLDSGLEPFADVLFEAATPAAGEAVLDIGCGCGATTLQAAELVGTRGRAVGVDVSAIMLERARERARTLELDHVRFEHADAQTDDLGAESFDTAVSRFGVMFFTDPEQAFRNVSRAMRRGGRLAFVCWQKIENNPWMLLPTLAAAQYVTIQRPADATAPGPFAFADAQRVQRILSETGWRDVAVVPFETALTVGGGGFDDAVEFMMEMGPASQALRDADPATRGCVREAIAKSMTPYVRDGVVKMDSASWIFTATRVG